MSQEASGLTEDRKKVLKRAFFMGSATLISRVLGLLRDVALGALFDRAVTDAWAAAFRIPNLFRRLFGEGALAISFIPVFFETQVEDPSGVRTKNLLNGFYTLLLLIIGTGTLLGIIYTNEIFRLLVTESYSLSTEKWQMTVRFGRIMFGFVFFVSAYAYFMGILNALGSFGLPALAPALLNISMLVFTFLPTSWFPGRGDGLAWGVFVGGLLQAWLLWRILKKRNLMPHWKFRFWNLDVKKMLLKMGPGLLGVGLLQFSTLLNLYFASALSEGSISYIYWADRLLELPLSLISVSLGGALLPTLSEFNLKKDVFRFRETSQEIFLMNIFLALPAALGLYLLAKPIVALLFFRGQFSIEDVEKTAKVLEIYAGSLILISISRVLTPLFHAIQNTWYPAMATLCGLIVHFHLASYWWAQLGIVGLVTSSLVGALFSAVILMAGLFFWELTFAWRALARSLFKMSIPCLGLLAVIEFYIYLQQRTPDLGKGALVAAIVLAGGLYGLLAHVVGCHEYTKIRRLFQS